MSKVETLSPSTSADLRPHHESCKWLNEQFSKKTVQEQELELLRLLHLQDLEEATMAGITEEQMNRLRREHEEDLMELKVQHAKHAIPHTSYLIRHTDPWIMGNGKQAGCSPRDAFLQSPIPGIGSDVLSALIHVLLSREGGWVGLGLGNELGG